MLCYLDPLIPKRLPGTEAQEDLKSCGIVSSSLNVRSRRRTRSAGTWLYCDRCLLKLFCRSSNTIAAPEMRALPFRVEVCRSLCWKFTKHAEGTAGHVFPSAVPKCLGNLAPAATHTCHHSHFHSLLRLINHVHASRTLLS